MKRILLITALATVLTITATTSVAQPKARRQQTTATPQQQGISQRARLMYPTSLDMPEDVVWRRDLYREIHLDTDANSGLYYPVEPIDRQLNLFTYIFKLALNGYIPIYEYRLDGQESFSDSSRVAIKTVLDDQQIYYEKKNNRLHVDNSDIPSADVKLYYLKESAYYDQTNAQFRRKVIALCPVIVLDDEFGGMPSKRPLFWVRYADLEPFLNRQTVTASSVNDAATMTLEDYFTLHCYQGPIYKTGQRQGKRMPQFGDTADADQQQQAALRQAKQIDEELAAFERRVFGHTPQRDSIEAANKKALEQGETVKSKKAKTVRSRRVRTVKSKAAPRSSSSSAGSRQPRVTVRRQRH